LVYAQRLVYEVDTGEITFQWKVALPVWYPNKWINGWVLVVAEFKADGNTLPVQVVRPALI
jgi:hypothetical protein